VDNVLVVGDSGNDISMFQAFPGRSFCMDHSLEDVKQHASFVIKRFSDIENYVYPSAETTAETTIEKEGN
jgi:hydroxymethylpyrimidine pyrophosphatase-like HAD family hydrolase